MAQLSFACFKSLMRASVAKTKSMGNHFWRGGGPLMFIDRCGNVLMQIVPRLGQDAYCPFQARRAFEHILFILHCPVYTNLLRQAARQECLFGVYFGVQSIMEIVGKENGWGEGPKPKYCWLQLCPKFWFDLGLSSYRLLLPGYRIVRQRDWLGHAGT